MSEEQATITMYDEAETYFSNMEYNNSRFWERMGHRPDFSGKCVMDFGCSIGGLTIDIAASKPEKVIGLDIASGPISFAKQYLNQNYPHLSQYVEYVAMDIHDYVDTPQFDYIITRNTFEHVIHLPEVMDAIKKRLKVGGKLYAGFGPLYNSPMGDHSLTKTIPPYGHVMKSEEQIVKAYNARSERQISSIHDLGLNKLNFADYDRIIKASGMKVHSYRINQPKNTSLLWRSIAFGLSSLRKIPFLREYCTFNIYCILEKQA